MKEQLIAFVEELKIRKEFAEHESESRYSVGAFNDSYTYRTIAGTTGKIIERLTDILNQNDHETI